MAKTTNKKKSHQEFSRGLKEGFNEKLDKVLAKPRKYAEQQVNKGQSQKAKAVKASYDAGKAFGSGKVSKGIEKGFQSLGNHIASWVTSGWGKILTGVFNDPDWYKYHGWATQVAFNTSRPMDPVSLKSIAGALPTAPLNGVTHVIQQNLVFENTMDTEAFKLATVEAFREIRLDLRSNLLYTQEQYDSYVAWVLAIAVKAYAIERTLGMVNKTRPDIPEFNEAMGSVTANYVEFGKVTPASIAMISDDNYANSLSEYRKLQSVVRMIQIPEKLNQFAKWWVSGLFIDQTAPNPQIYVNMLRSCPIYRVTSENTLLQVGDFDIQTGTVSEVVSECLALLESFGILNADIAKTGRYGTLALEDIDGYVPHIFCDYEFFSVLINSYQSKASDLVAQINKEYIRVDFLNELSNANTVGVCNALAPWADVPVPLRIVSQAAYFTADASQRSTRNASGIADLETGKLTERVAYVLASAPMFIQITGDMHIINSFVESSDEETIISTYTPSIKFSGGSVSPTSATILTAPWTIEFPERSVTEGIGRIIASYQADGVTKYLLVGVGDGVAKFYYGALSNRVVSAAGSFEIQGAKVVSTVDSKGYAIRRVYVSGSSTSTIPSAAYDDMLAVFTVGSTISVSWLSALTISYVVNDLTTVAYTMFDALTLATFCEQVDYHLPIYARVSQQLRNESEDTTLIVYGLPHLLKECYIPTILNKADVSSVLYWMYLGLFSIDRR
jgi:hypothetical protein